MRFRSILIYLCIALLFSSCGKKDDKNLPQSDKTNVITKIVPIQGKILFDSNQDARTDRVKSLYLWENGKTRKFFKGCSYPRWSPDGEKIACILWEQQDGKTVTGNIGILDREGKLIQKVKPKYSVLRLEWTPDGRKIIYVAWPWELKAGSSNYLSSLELATFAENILYQTGPSGRVGSLTWNYRKDLLVINLLDRLKSDKDLVSRAALFDPKTFSLSFYYDNIGSSIIMLSDDKNLIFTGNRTPDGGYIEQLHWGVLIKYNIEIKEYQVIRPTEWVRNIRLSQDGKYVYISEPAEGEGVAIHIYSVDNLKYPIYVIPPMKDERGTPSQDLNPDWLPS